MAWRPSPALPLRPQEWLWCESWCGNATKAAAKTIDLCNNPQTKEPKLEGARSPAPPLDLPLLVDVA